ncbi:MAG: TIGR04255 family protein [Candidatus Binatus sp.]|uniref:TIGR04255 family protein n=1 Tax=Candidatus Binatus sp. TaxID=2811406 RepID=UPI00271D26DA|nr:TIGR04255 family protein [Candidatus Binatus sp.]MDO8431340.1 TIGR04255 family protein [Candidatus Binatus sp.]
MARKRHLSRAPITEALIDIQVTPKEGLTFDALRAGLDASAFGYYAKGAITESLLQFNLPVVGQELQTSSQAAQVGIRFHSNDEKYVAQCRLTGFTLSRLPPYENWENLRTEATRIWNVYAERLAPARVTRIATRFINNLPLPMQTGESYQLYLNKVVDVPEEAPQAVETFFQRFQLVDTETGARVILTLTQGGGAAGGVLPVILDVDAFTQTDLNPGDPAIWAILERLRDLKNRTFFGTITERAAGLYE